MTLRMVELFAGIGAQAMAMENLGFDHKVVAICEIDKSAVKSYYAIHGEVPNLGDITKVERLPDCDLLTYTFPCQDLSIAGNKKGCSRDSGTRSGLLWEVERLLLEMKESGRLPMTLLMENVPALGFKANIRDFNEWISSLSDMGYTSSYKVLDAADFGVPQRRKRLFMISRLDGMRFDFPKPRPLDKCLADVLEENVPESYFLKPEVVAKYEAHKTRHIERGNGFGWDPYDPRERERKCSHSESDKEHSELHQKQGGCRVTIEGYLGKRTQHYTVYGTEGLSATLAACDHKDPNKVVIR